jgi:Mrp family chromosome partitioning ATPase
MGNGPCAFKEADVRRAVKALRAAGVDVAGVRFNKDGFTVITGKPGGSAKIADNEVEDWINKHAS